jgi:hypothetical protein
MHVIIAIVLIYVIIHGLTFRHHRRNGLGLWVSMRGPFHTRISKRL